jgi:GntR family transcriptional regulator
LRTGAAPVSLPIHELIQQSLRRRIEQGELTEGSQLPSEAALQREFHASRTPVRQALRRLQSDGLIVRAQGRGSYVASSKFGVALRPMVSFSGELRRQGHRVASRTLAIEKAVPPLAVSQALRLDGEEATLVRRLLVVDGVPLAFFEHWLPPALPHEVFHDAGDFPSLYELLREQGSEPWYGTETIGATVADQEAADLLGCGRGEALMVLRRISRDIEHRPIEFTTYLVRADRYEYEINLMRQRR